MAGGVTSLIGRSLRSTISGAAEIAQGLSSLVFPANCALCGAGASSQGAPLCPACVNEVKLCGPEFCLNCGAPKPLHTGITKLCVHCDREAVKFNLDGVVAAGAFDGALRECVLRLKFSGERALAKPLSAWMLEALSKRSYKPTRVVALPLSSARLWERGYNQADELARPLAQALGLEYLPDALRRNRHTSPQTILSTSAERTKNVRGAFGPGRDALRLRGQRVLLIDDVATTGASLSEAASALRKLGARQVYGVLAARTLADGPDA